MQQIIPSLFNADLLALESEIRFMEKRGIERLHVDMMDGNYVPNIAFGPDQIAKIKANTSLKVDVHMMVNQPEKLIQRVIDAGADFISIHHEATPHVHEVVKTIQKSGVKAGVALNPGTAPSTLKYLLDSIDFVLLMSVNPGHWNQAFVDTTFDKIKETKALIAHRNVEIEIDGKMNPERIQIAKDLGASMFVVGSYLFDGNKEKNLRKLLEIV